MILSFSKYNSIVHLIVGITIFIVLNRYIYGGFIIGYAALIGFHSFILQNEDFSSISKYTSIPAYSVLGIIIPLSLYILYKSTKTTNPQKAFVILQLVFAILSNFLIRFLKLKIDIFNQTFINYVPTLLFLSFVISISIIPENQSILRKIYNDITYEYEQLRKP